MPITKVGRPCRDCKSITCYCHDPACTMDTTVCPALVPVETYGHHRADLAPSAPAPVVPRVKPLVWAPNGNGEWAKFDLSGEFSAYYTIDPCDYDLASVSFSVLCHEFGDQEIWKGPKAEAKAAAQADYEARILSQIDMALVTMTDA